LTVISRELSGRHSALHDGPALCTSADYPVDNPCGTVDLPLIPCRKSKKQSSLF
jgi:hypothetical protein